MKQQKKNAIFAILFFSFYVVLDYFIDDYLFELTYKIYQNSINYSQHFLIISYYLKDSLIICEIMVFYFYLSFNKKLDILLLIMFCYFLSGTHAFIKEIYNQGRPYMINSEKVKTLECITELGKPSGHTTAIISYMIAFYYIDKFENEEEMKFSLLKKICYTFIAFIVAFSRILLGVHSLGQVLYATNFTISMSIIYLNYIHSILKKLLQKYQKNPNHKLTFVVAGLFLFFVCISFSADLYSRHYFAMNSEIYYKYIDAIQQCRKENNMDPISDEKGFILQKSTIKSYGFYFIIIGILLGFVIFRGYYEEGIYCAQIKLRNKFIRFTRIFIFFLLEFIIIKTLFSFDPQTHEQLLALIIIGCIIEGLFVTLFYPLLLYVFGMEVFGSLQCVEQSKLFIDYSHIWDQESLISI